jgi:CheY-like chemotaxis protein
MASIRNHPSSRRQLLPVEVRNPLMLRPMPRSSNQPLRGRFVPTILEWTAVCAAGFVGLLTMVLYGLSREISLPIIGLAMVSAGAMGALHPLAADQDQGLRILIEEDDPVNQKVLSKLLLRLGCKVECVDNGHDAVAKITAETYDLVSMDCQMPQYGWLRGHALGEAQEGKHAIVIAMTANARLTTRELCLQSGMDDYMTKPVQASLLAETLDSRKAGEGCSAAL